MNRGRLVVLLSTGGVVVLLLGTLFVAPVGSIQAVKSSYHALPDDLEAAVPDEAEAWGGDVLDGVARAFAGGRVDQLVRFPLELVDASVDPGGWTSAGDVALNWTDLANGGIRYEIRRGSSADPSASELVVSSDLASAMVPLSEEGVWFVFVTAVSGGARGPTASFGPFGSDSTPPPAPGLVERPDPPGYSFAVDWGTVTDASGIARYELERRSGGGGYASVYSGAETSHAEVNLGNGLYTYRVRAVNGAEVPSLWSDPLDLEVSAPMANPGAGSFDYGIHANFTSFIHLWDLEDTSAYLRLADLNTAPHQAIRESYTGEEWGIEVENATLIALVESVVGTEQNTFKIAEKLFVYLYNATDYDFNKSGGADQNLLRAGETLDRGGGICGDLAVLYITLLRIAGVPARPVHGYLDNPDAGIGDFHMWVEAYVGGPDGYPWMTVDVSGVSGTFTPEKLAPYFAVFNPDYLSLGTEVVYDPLTEESASWNTWARFSWTCTGASCPSGFIDAEGVPETLSSDSMFLLFKPSTRQRELIEDVNGDHQLNPSEVPPTVSCGQAECFFYEVHTRVVKRIDYGASLASQPSNLDQLRFELRYPAADDYSATNPWQSVIYTVYERSSGSYDVGSDGFVSFTENF